MISVNFDCKCCSSNCFFLLQVKAILHDFYESVFPLHSQFELSLEYRNRFIHVDELREWKAYRDWMKLLTHISIILLVLLIVSSYFSDQVSYCRNTHYPNTNCLCFFWEKIYLILHRSILFIMIFSK